MNNKKSLLIFTGAGFSKALNLDFPLTNEIYDRIKDEITYLNYFKYYYETDFQSEIRDVEILAHVLSSHVQPIEQSIHILHKCQEYTQSEKYDVFDHGNLQGGAGPTDHLQPIRRTCRANLKHIHEAVLKPLFTTQPKSDAVTKMKYIIEQLKKKCQLNIFSTNYDRAIRPILLDKDYYLDDSEVKIDLLFNPDNPNGYCYIPLKGMLDWKLIENTMTIYQMPKFEQKIENSAVMPLQDTSGFQKLPHKELYDKFQEELGKAEYLLFIGYSFRDEAINEAIRAIDSSKIKGLAIVHKESGETEQEIAKKGVAFQEKIKQDLFPDYQGKPFIPYGFVLDDPAVDMMHRISDKLFPRPKKLSSKGKTTTTQAISTTIKTTLSAVRDNGQVVFKDIIEGKTKQFSDFPGLTIHLSGMESEIASNVENLRRYNFLINCYMEGDLEAFGDAMTFQEIIVNALDKSKDLGNSGWIVMPAQMTEITKEMLGRRECLKISINLVVKAIELVS